MLSPSSSTLVFPYVRLHEPLDKNATLTVHLFFHQLAQQVIPHLSDARSAKSSFQLATVLSYAKQTAMSTVAKELRPGASYWEAVGEAIAQLAGECNKLLPIALEPENVVKSTFLLPCCRPSMTLVTFDSHRYIALGRACRRSPSQHSDQRRGRAQGLTVPRRDSESCSQSQIERPDHPRVDCQN